jgi:hypothetical protein
LGNCEHWVFRRHTVEKAHGGLGWGGDCLLISAEVTSVLADGHSDRAA